MEDIISLLKLARENNLYPDIAVTSQCSKEQLDRLIESLIILGRKYKLIK